MSVWSKIAEAAHRAFDPEADAPAEPTDVCAPDPNDVGFTAAVIGLAAKMARADGEASEQELAAAARVFRPPPGEEAAFRRVFAIAQQSVLGFESYAKQIGKKYRNRPCLLEDVLDGLFHIAGVDGAISGRELYYLRVVADLMGLSDLDFRRIKATHLGPDPGDPYSVLGLLPGASLEDSRAAWRKLATENHPDTMAARGAPPEFVAIAERKMVVINDAWAKIRAELSEMAPSP